MNWKKVAETNDLIVFENSFKKHKIKIEARKRDNGWEVFKTKVEGDSANLISEHLMDNKSQAIKLIAKLKRDKKTSIIKKKIVISLKRLYKEDFIEKWSFYINNENTKNFIYVKFDTKIQADIVMHEKFIFDEKSIISQISEKLGLTELGESTNFEVFYFRKYSTNLQKKELSPFDTNFVDVEFDFSDEEYY